MIYKENYQLKELNSFRLESTAKNIWFPETFEELFQVKEELKKEKFYILGQGTNVIFRPTVTNIISMSKLPFRCNFSKEDEGITEVSSNIPTSYFIREAIKNEFKGLEGMIGMPGTVGGAVIMNAGSGSYSISDYLESVNIENKYIDYKHQLNFGRRYCNLQGKNDIITKVNFRLKKGVIHKDEYDKAIIHRSTLPKEPSAGGIFKNWHYLKPFAEELIGMRVGDAVVSTFPNIIVNTNQATYHDILALIFKIRAKIKVHLDLEVQIMGDCK